MNRYRVKWELHMEGDTQETELECSTLESAISYVNERMLRDGDEIVEVELLTKGTP